MKVWKVKVKNWNLEVNSRFFFGNYFLCVSKNYLIYLVEILDT